LPTSVLGPQSIRGTHYRLKAYPIDGREQFLFITHLTLRGKAVLRRLGIESTAATAVVPAGG